jgi:hypothetical protein
VGSPLCKRPGPSRSAAQETFSGTRSACISLITWRQHQPNMQAPTTVHNSPRPNRSSRHSSPISPQCHRATLLTPHTYTLPAEGSHARSPILLRAPAPPSCAATCAAAACSLAASCTRPKQPVKPRIFQLSGRTVASCGRRTRRLCSLQRPALLSPLQLSIAARLRETIAPPIRQGALVRALAPAACRGAGAGLPCRFALPPARAPPALPPPCRSLLGCTSCAAAPAPRPLLLRTWSRASSSCPAGSPWPR